jgi:hypothetical protein
MRKHHFSGETDSAARVGAVGGVLPLRDLVFAMREYAEGRIGTEELTALVRRTLVTRR